MAGKCIETRLMSRVFTDLRQGCKFWACVCAGVGLDRIRQDILAGRYAKAEGLTTLTVHDIMCAVLWIIKCSLFNLPSDQNMHDTALHLARTCTRRNACQSSICFGEDILQKPHLPLLGRSLPQEFRKELMDAVMTNEPHKCSQQARSMSRVVALHLTRALVLRSNDCRMSLFPPYSHKASA